MVILYLGRTNEIYKARVIKMDSPDGSDLGKGSMQKAIKRVFNR